MQKRKKPERSCIVCRNKFDKRDLLRIVKNKDGDIFYDETGKANGRGAYVCKSEKCINTFLNKNFLDRAYRQSIDKEKIENVKEQLKSLNLTNCEAKK